MNHSRHPLAWPPGRSRTPAAKRERSRFRHGADWGRGSWNLPDATVELLRQLEMSGAEARVVVSTNVELRRDGLPYARRPAPFDVGAAVYFQLDGVATALACDKWDRVADNVRALAKFVEAMRGMERWVGEGIVRAAYTGFQGLPGPGASSGEAWWDVLGVEPTATREQVDSAARQLLAACHPDTGDDRQQWDRVSEARNQGRNATEETA